MPSVDFCLLCANGPAQIHRKTNTSRWMILKKQKQEPQMGSMTHDTYDRWDGPEDLTSQKSRALTVSPKGTINAATVSSLAAEQYWRRHHLESLLVGAQIRSDGSHLRDPR